MGWLLLFVDLGGALDAISLYAIRLIVTNMVVPSDCIAKIFLNVAGSFGKGMMRVAVVSSTSVFEPMRDFVVVGFLGVLTTFSSFASDVFSVFTRGTMIAGSSYLMSFVCLSLAGFCAGLLFMRLFMGQS